jgi:hypothetical protein
MALYLAKLLLLEKGALWLKRCIMTGEILFRDKS